MGLIGFLLKKRKETMEANKVIKELETILPPTARKRKIGQTFMKWNWSWPENEVKKLLELTKETLNSKSKSIEEKEDYLSDLEDVIEFSDQKTKNFDLVINYLIDFVLEYKTDNSEADEEIKENIFYLIDKAQYHQDMTNINFYTLANNLSTLPNGLQRYSIEILGFTENKEFIPYIKPYTAHQNENVREWAKIAIKNLECKKEEAMQDIRNYDNKFLNQNIEKEEVVKLQTTHTPASEQLKSNKEKVSDREQLILDIKNKGYNISSIEDLSNLNLNLKSQSLISLLLKGLKSIEDEQDKAFIVRCLGIKGLTQVTKILLNEFENATTNSYKYTIGNSICIISDMSILDKLLAIVVNKNHGIARQMLVYGLGNYKGKELKKTLLNLLTDEEVLEQAIHALGKMNDRSIIPHIEAFTNHSKENIRSEAIKAIEELKKSPTIQERKIILD